MHRHRSRAFWALAASLVLVAPAAGALPPSASLMRVGPPAGAKTKNRDALWAAVRAGDAKAVAAALDGGARVNATNEIGVTALWIAAGKGKLDVIDLLICRGADVNARDGIWYQTPLSLAVGGRRLAAAHRLIKAGAKDVEAALFTAASQGNEAMVRIILDRGELSQDALDAALYLAATAKRERLSQALKLAGARPLPPAKEPDRKAWAKPLYGPHLYTCSNSGVLACYEAATGKEVYKRRISSGDSYTASPVAADGRLYFASEQGQVRVVKAGPELKLLAVNKVGDYVMATPAISNGALFVRSQHFLMALGKKADGKTK